MSTGRPTTRQLLLLGVAQAVLFVVGAVVGRWLGLAFGLDAFGPGYGNGTVFGILLIGLGGGAGAHLARTWFMRKYGSARN
ncbi:hypothetical protein GCM10023165_36200 [Variovorax defluvii]|uniref:AtpZ/AtpI family protein n=1 Tax=Variovorax defluvii TaxID=913761 RepID=A0ABP8I1T9_9BURK